MADSDPGFSFELSLYNRLHYHYFSDTSDRIEELFLDAAKDVHKQWVRKPLGEPDTAPSPTRLPRSASEPERCALTRRLHDILEELVPPKTPSILESRYTITPQRREPPLSPSIDRQLQRLKRLSEEQRISSPSFSSKKPRSVAPSVSLSRHNEEETDEEEDLEPAPPIRRTIFTNPRPQSQESRRGRSRTGLYQLGESTNTSRSTFVSKVFDQVEGDPPIASQQTQTTVEASTQEKMRRPPHSSDSVSDFAPSTSTEMALHTSFINYEQTLARPAPSNPSQENVRRALGPSSRASDSYSDFSIPLDLVATFDNPTAASLPSEPSVVSPTDSPARSPVPSPSKPPKTPQAGKMSLEDRLQNVWRRYLHTDSPCFNPLLIIPSAAICFS